MRVCSILVDNTEHPAAGILTPGSARAPPPSRRTRRPSVARCVARTHSPVTVAGPRRIHTGFPDTAGLAEDHIVGRPSKSTPTGSRSRGTGDLFPADGQPFPAEHVGEAVDTRPGPDTVRIGVGARPGCRLGPETIVPLPQQPSQSSGFLTKTQAAAWGDPTCDQCCPRRPAPSKVARAAGSPCPPGRRVARGNPVGIRDCPAAVSGNDRRHTHWIRRIREATASRNPPRRMCPRVRRPARCPHVTDHVRNPGDLVGGSARIPFGEPCHRRV